MKPVVVVSKVGGVFYTRALASKNSKVGEQGETEGIIKHLLERNDIQVVYFGQWRGDIPNKMIYVEAFIDGLDELSTAAYQKECWAKDVKNLEIYEPKFALQVAGYASCNCSIDNPVGAAIQAAGIRYCGPLLNILQALKLPRLMVNNDPRSYPRESEMVWGWDYCRPRALLSQRTRNWTRRMRRLTFECREVYAGAENWCEHIQLSQHKTVPCTIVAHAHIKDGCRFAKRNQSWEVVLSPQEDVKALKHEGMRVYGKGWQHFSGYDPELMPGAIRPNEVMVELAKAKVCPAVAAGDNFYTGKLRTCLAQGCLPLFYGKGEPFTFDPLQKYIPFDSEARITRPGDLRRLVEFFDRDEMARQDLVNMLWDASAPDWTLFDKCINDALDGRDMKSEEWYQEYGGYRVCT